MIKKIRDVVGWFLTRFNKGHGLIGSVLAAFNFAGIFTLILAEPLGLPQSILLPIIMFFGFVGITVFSVIVFDIGNFQTVLAEKNGQLDDYWKTKLSPVQIKAYSLFIEMNKAVINKDLKKLEEMQLKLERGRL